MKNHKIILYLCVNAAMVTSSSHRLTATDQTPINDNSEIINLDPVIINAHKSISPFWSSKEKLLSTTLGLELIRSERSDVAYVSIDEDQNKRNEFRPHYSDINEWLLAVVRPYMIIMQKTDKNGFFTATCDAGNGKIAFLFYEKMATRARQHLIIIIDSNGKIISDPEKTIMLVREYSNIQMANGFKKANRVEVERHYKFLEGIIVSITNPEPNMKLIYKNPFADEFNKSVEELGYATAVLNASTERILEFK